MEDRSVLPRRTRADMQTLMQVALGAQPADLVVANADVVNVYTGEIQKNFGVAVKGRFIARVSDRIETAVGPATRVIDAGGKTLIPGLIDGHTHLAWLYTAAEFAPFAAASGVTTVVTEALEPYPVAGLEGLEDFLASLRGQPVRILATAPAMVSISAAVRGIAAADLKQLLAREDVVGLGESYWQAVLQEPDTYLPAFEEAHRAGKPLEGHTAGAGESRLAAYAAAGVSSCHEPINAAQALSRLRQGMWVMAREGGIRRDLAEIAKIRDGQADLRRLILASDGATAQDLLDGNYLAAAVQKAIACGFAPVAAVQMTTLNVAEHFRLDHLLGGIAPGRLADMVLIPDPATIRPISVILDGRVVFEEGRLLAPPRRHPFSDRSRNTVRLPRTLYPTDFAVRAPAGRPAARVRVIDMVTDLVTAELHLDLPSAGGEIQADPPSGICKIAAVDRTHRPGRMFTGFIRGFGLKSGAVACSAAWDTSAIVVVGADAADMAAAVNRVAALQGGAVVSDRGRVTAEIPLPVFGLACVLPMAELAKRLSGLTREAARLGVGFPDPLLSLITLTGAAIPYLRICEEGLVNLKDGRTVGLFVD
jgi:adenine deaminase